jgi:hypothetical protein
MPFNVKVKVTVTVKVKVKAMSRPTIGRSVCLRVKPPSGAQDQIFITVRELRVCSCGAPSLTRGRVCLQLPLALARAVNLGPESRGPHGFILLSQIRDSQPAGPGPRIYPPGTWLASYIPRHWVAFSSPPTTLRAMVQVFEPASTREAPPTFQDTTHYIQPRHGPRRNHRSSVVVQLLLRDGMTYSNAACTAIGTDCAENTIPLLLFTGRRLATASCCDFTIITVSISVRILFWQQ